MNQKDVIYIDIEDDITAIIDRVKGAKAEIVALVPPKRVGVLQSIVNLKLLKRAAVSAKKRIVLISSDPALASLAGGVKIPTAKNLQSRPEIAAVQTPNSEDVDVINGSELPVGEVNDALSGKKMPAVAPDSADKADEKTPPPVNKAVPLKKNGKSLLKVPDFLSFRKKLLIGGALLLLLGVLFWWAFWIAPTATVTITARTEVANIDEAVTLDPAASQSDTAAAVLKPLTQQTKKTATTDFIPTGKKDVGEKASGVVLLNNCESLSPITIPAGTAVSANGLNFITASSVTVSPVFNSGLVCNSNAYDSATAVKVTAQDIGEQYNLQSGTVFAVAGQSDKVTAKTKDGLSGGSKKQVTVVSDADVEQAKQKLASQNTDEIKASLEKQFSSGTKVLKESFSAAPGAPTVNPAVGTEASKATISVETNYSMQAIAQKDLEFLLKAKANEAITNKNEKSVYESGLKGAQLTAYKAIEGGKATIQLKATAYIGAKINEDQLKEKMVGKRYGEIESVVNQIPNVDKIDINFAPFWVSTAPSADKITLEFNVKKNE